MISEDRSTACPLCGDVCHCTSEPQPASNYAPARSRFEPDSKLNPRVQQNLSTTLIDPEANDNTEEQFAASLEQPAPLRQRFIVEGVRRGTNNSESPELVEAGINEKLAEDPDAEAPSISSQAPPPTFVLSASPSILACAESEHRDSGESHSSTGMASSSVQEMNQGATLWKQEVAARLDSYRARRKPKGPRYPSMRLKFETAEDRAHSFPSYESPMTPRNQSKSRTGQHDSQHAILDQETAGTPQTAYAPPQAKLVVTEPARIIEFPRSYEPPVRSDELAEPIFDRPRILDAPEIEPPLPALGGIILETEENEPERRPGFELPLRSAPGKQRILATVIDAAIVLVASGIFAYVFFRMTGTVPPAAQLAGLLLVVPAIFWIVYDYLLMVYVGQTPGMRARKLVLTEFDGSPVKRKIRRWRTLASIVSLIPLGLGILWCYLDEDALCWHDRITNTHLIAMSEASLPAPDLLGN